MLEISSSRTVILLFCFIFIVNINTIKTNNVTIVSNVSDHILQKALNYLKKDSFNQHVYSSGTLVTAQKWQESPNIFYRLTLNLEPNCTDDISCPRQMCTIVLKKDENNIIEIDEESKDCKYDYPRIDKDELEQTVSIGKLEERTVTQEEEEIIRNLEKQIVNPNSKSKDQADKNNEESVPVKKIRRPYYCPGCPYDLNTSLPGLEAFKELAEKSVDKSSQSNYKRRVININRVTYEVPPGSNFVRYRILMEFGLTNCLKTDDNSRSECVVKTSEPTNICSIIFDEDLATSSRRISGNNCTGLNDNLNVPELIGESLTKSYSDDEIQKESKTELYDQVAQEGQINTFQSSIDDLFEVSVPNVESSTHQEYSGPEVTEVPFQQTVITNGDVNTEPESHGFHDKVEEFVKFLENFDIPVKNKKEEITNYGKPVVEEVIKPERVERSRRNVLVGGETEANVDKDVSSYIDLGMKHISKNHTGNYELVPVKILHVTKQVVAGTLYRIKVQVGESNCSRGQLEASCLFVETNPVKEYQIEAWVRPWISKDPEITVTQIESNRRKRHLRGQNYSEKMLRIFEEQKQNQENEYKISKEKFQQFKKDFNKIYLSKKEEKLRFKIFQENLKTIEKLQKGEQGTATYGPTMFADLSADEFRSYLGYRKDLRLENSIPLRRAEIPDIELPKEFDWRNSNVVTPVKDQGSCGSCWAFSVTGNVEGQYAIKHGKLLSLSEQELVDCDDLDEGCNGGLQENAYKALEKLGGLELEKEYPYDARDDTCHFKKSDVAVKVVDGVNITSNETQMAQWLVKNGPMAIAINANAMQFYMGGISHPFKFLCNPASLDHGVLIVGYGIHKYPLFKKELPYWIVKNSWGTRWGEQGYYRVYRGDGTCGLNADVSSAIVA